jgi:hypothetical protein
VSKGVLQVSDLRSSTTAKGFSRVEATVDGELLWFESKDAVLAASPEAYASALLIPAAASNRLLQIDAAIDATWLNQVPDILRLLTSWWDIGQTHVLADTSDVSSRPAMEKSAQCFSGGVDSYYALATASPPPDILVFAQGYDIPLSDEHRLDAFRPSLEETAEAFNARPIVIYTNLRSHSVYKQVNWEWSHGGALAALGHLLGDEIGKLVVPSSYPYHDARPWGTRWDIDPLWSSSKMVVEHADATLRRNGKVREIVKHPVAMSGLRVCWENLGPTGNCSSCEKCVRTMLALHICGQLSRCETFDLSVPLDERLDALFAPTHLCSIYEELREDITDPTVLAAVDRLITRSRHTGKLHLRIARRIRRAFSGRPAIG